MYRSLKSDARWYVYALTDPRDGAVFYVGKGTGSRIHQHEKDAANEQTVCSKKINKIRELQALNLNVGKETCAVFWDEQAAYDHETDLIEEIGLENLTNVLPGGQKAWERRRVEREARRIKPWHEILAAKDAKHLMARMAEWLKVGGHKGQKVSITTEDPHWKLTCRLSEAFYNDIMPSLWRRIVDDGMALAVVRRGLLPYGVELA